MALVSASSELQPGQLSRPVAASPPGRTGGLGSGRTRLFQVTALGPPVWEAHSLGLGRLSPNPPYLCQALLIVEWTSPPAALLKPQEGDRSNSRNGGGGWRARERWGEGTQCPKQPLSVS